MISMPGAFTPTEIQNAHRFGADFVKLFPVEKMGADYVKTVKEPLSHIKLFAVGKINERNMRDYLDAGVSGFAIGSAIADKKFIADNDFEKICELAKRHTQIIINRKRTTE